jgi:hypothetical protein
VGSAQFALVFDDSGQPQRAEYLAGDTALRAAAARLSSQEFPVRFPEVSSVKIVLRAILSCNAAGCAATLQPPGRSEAGGMAATGGSAAQK